MLVKNVIQLGFRALLFLHSISQWGYVYEGL